MIEVPSNRLKIKEYTKSKNVLAWRSHGGTRKTHPFLHAGWWIPSITWITNGKLHRDGVRGGHITLYANSNEIKSIYICRNGSGSVEYGSPLAFDEKLDY